MFKIAATNLTIMVSDMDESLAFYIDVLGFELIQRYGNHYAQISAPGIVIGLHPKKKELSRSNNISIGFAVGDLEEARREFVGHSIVFDERKEEGGAFIHFNDPDGNPLYFIKPKI